MFTCLTLTVCFWRGVSSGSVQINTGGNVFLKYADMPKEVAPREKGHVNAESLTDVPMEDKRRNGTSGADKAPDSARGKLKRVKKIFAKRREPDNDTKQIPRISAHTFLMNFSNSKIPRWCPKPVEKTEATPEKPGRVHFARKSSEDAAKDFLLFKSNLFSMKKTFVSESVQVDPHESRETVRNDFKNWSENFDRKQDGSRGVISISNMIANMQPEEPEEIGNVEVDKPGSPPSLTILNEPEEVWGYASENRYRPDGYAQAYQLSSEIVRRGVK